SKRDWSSVVCSSDLFLHRERRGLGPQRIGIVDLESAVARTLDEIDRGALHQRSAVGVDQHVEQAGFMDAVGGRSLGSIDERQAVLESARPATLNAEAQ